MESMTNRESIWGLRTFVVVTGASRGIGKTIAIEFARLIDKNSTMLLLARSLNDLKETRTQILSVRADVDVKVQSIDLSTPDETLYSQALTSAAKNVSYDLYLLVNNAGTIKHDTPAALMADVNTWNEFMTINLYSTAMLTCTFLKLFKKGRRCIVNMSSSAAHKPWRGLAMYSAAKAARELYFKVLAVEDPSINVLNYSPGPIDTDLFRSTATECCFPDTLETCAQMLKTNGCVKVEDTVAKLISVLREQRYENGGSVDYLERF